MSRTISARQWGGESGTDDDADVDRNTSFEFSVKTN